MAAEILKTESLAIRCEEDIVLVRQKTRKLAADIGMSIVDQTKMVTAASELARNALIYGGGGEAIFEILENSTGQGLRIRFVDHGPGIPDIEQAMTDGFTTGNGLGLGLSGSKRLVNDFSITSVVGEGTTVEITRWK
ncbi:anti-sigma regulatory factor [Gracilinema caldarium]|uniref:anti-sigma regulatory factor n=1 Tax=Gracilinema caldarium TaxID=215591 RepID=UPI0026F1897C|nr:anti-sigma regulatory factor [Gracilinema caldarium]